MSETFKIIFRILLGVFLTGYGIYLCYAAVKNKKKFLDAHKRIDLIKIFGNFGRVLYAILGLAIAACGVYITFIMIKELINQ